jgi:hypothetical protein
MITLLLIILMINSLVIQAQVFDDFSDADFTVNPQWTGDDAYFFVNSNLELQSNGPQASSTIYLSTANSLIDSTEWIFYIRLGFNPSSTNYVRVYLVSDQQNLSGSLNGYFVQFGQAGSAPDSLLIYKQTGTTTTKIFAGTSGCMSSSTVNAVRVKIQRRSNGLWQIYADCSGGDNYNFEGQFTENSYTATSYFGVYCRYATASRYNLYHFDDITIRPIVADTVRPTVQLMSAVSPDLINVKFSEAVELASAQNILNYSFDAGIGNPMSAIRSNTDFSLVQLSLQDPLINGVVYTLTVEQVKDLSGNVMLPFTSEVVYYIPVKGDIVINEIMADPTPQVNLPNGEFLELKNNKNFPISISGWAFSDASSTVTITNLTIPADSFVVLCAASLVDSFAARGFNNILIKGLSSLPTLNNSADSLTLRDQNGNIIDRVNYTDAWYRSSVKKNGGWTLERIDPTTSCGEGENWTASTDPNGGTPGTRNSVQGTFADTAAPFVTTYDIVSGNTIQLLFSEAIDSIQAGNPLNYTLDNDIGNPQTVVVLSGMEVILIFASNLDSSVIYQLTLQNISDCIGNTVSAVPVTIVIPGNAAPFDILMTELFPDPDPAVGLPQAEFVELYNRSQKAISLKDWTFSDASGSATLPAKILLPNEYVVITGTSNVSQFMSYGAVLGVGTLPTLNNDGDELTLRDVTGKTIHHVKYTSGWYWDNIKKNGGWTLEMIDPYNPCAGAANWKASEAPSGGTPAATNSVNGYNPDNTAPALLYALVNDSISLTLVFDEPLDSASVIGTGQFEITPGNIQITEVIPQPPAFTQVLLLLGAPLQKSVIYTVSVAGFTDCAGNVIAASNAPFGIPEQPATGDVIINEILFNPESYGSDFVELYNRSEKVIDLKTLYIVQNDYVKQDSTVQYALASESGYLLLPGQYVALTADPAYIKNRYFSENPERILLVKSMPNYPDKEGVVVVMDLLLQTIDKVSYTEKWHHPMIDDKNGVSLERIQFNRPSQERSNWHSAASTVGFATPAYKNSQFKETVQITENITISPEAFSPDNDGYNDFLNIYYRFEEPGWTANIRIFDAGGRPVRDLIRNELLATEGVLQWNGFNDDGKKVRLGIYIIFIELFSPDGEVKKYKKSCVVGGQIE